MIDFIKTNIDYLPVNYYDNSQLLDFDTTVDNNGEIKKRVAAYQNLKFIITHEKYININGSLHKYFNGGGHNHNSFSIPQLLGVCIELSNKFDINPFLTTLHNVEFGVNVALPFDTNRVLNSIISYKGKEGEIERYNGKGYLIRFSFDHYDLKIYNKGLQYKQDSNILRFEIKVKKMEYFKQRGIDIKYLSDLLKPVNYEPLRECLSKAFKEVLMYDNSIKLKGLPQREKTALINGRNPKYWVQLKEQGKEIKKRRKRFRELVLKYGKDNFQSQIHTKIVQSSLELTQINEKERKEIDKYLNSFKDKTAPNITDLSSAAIYTPQPRNNTSNKELIQHPKQRYCNTCGRDISNQRKGSVFCSEKVYGKEGKRCRNKRSNRTHTIKSKELKLYSGLLLFEVEGIKTRVY